MVAVSAKLRPQQVLLVLLLQQLFIDFGNVLRNDLCIGVRMDRSRWHRLKVVMSSSKLTEVAALARRSHVLLMVLLVRILKSLCNLILRVATGIRSSIVRALPMPPGFVRADTFVLA